MVPLEEPDAHGMLRLLRRQALEHLAQVGLVLEGDGELGIEILRHRLDAGRGPQALRGVHDPRCRRLAPAF